MINVAVIGCGYWGPNLIRNFNSLNECKVKLICDTDKNRLSYLSGIYPMIKTTTRYDDIINDSEIDGVAIATPVSMHFKLAKKSLLAGKHTLIEKPMTSSAKTCKELVETAKEKNATLMVGHTFIYSPIVRKIKEIIEHNDIGELLYISSRRLNLGLFQKDINVAWDLAPHDISIILYLINQEPIAVNCQGKSHMNTGIEDVTSMSLDFSSGGFATIQSSWLDPNKVREMIIVGSKRMIVYDDTQTLEKIKIYDKRVETPPHYDTFAEFHFSYYYGDVYSPYIKQEEPLKIECQHFLDCIKTGSIPETSGQDGLRVVQVLEASSKSLQEGGARIKIADI
ncbi:MAG: Gfo/Idh/MocA family oxidoreductase [Spirochaetes bacterium]|nr:Gfo/Idh/MocA family oxidoreductase [Spirochaetota bacterium]